MVLPRLGLQAKGAFCPEEVVGRVVLKRRKLEQVVRMTRKYEKNYPVESWRCYCGIFFAGLVLKVSVSFHL